MYYCKHNMFRLVQSSKYIGRFHLLIEYSDTIHKMIRLLYFHTLTKGLDWVYISLPLGPTFVYWDIRFIFFVRSQEKIIIWA